MSTSNLGLPSVAGTPERTEARTRTPFGDLFTKYGTLLCASTIVLLAIALFFGLWMNSELARHKFGLGFLTAKDWDPVAGNFGALPFVVGTLLSSLIALMIAIPLGVGAAMFLSELAPAGISDALTFLIELLAAVPSVIYGLLGIFVLIPFLKKIEPGIRAVLGWTPFFQGPFYGPSLFTAGVVLAVMIVPFIISISREVLLSVPRDQREAALALGATRWETTYDVVLPFARTGVLGSIFLALARALGETMAVTMVIGNDPHMKLSWLAPSTTIAAEIANEFAEATEALYTHTLIELGLVLFVLTFVLNGLARLLIMATAKKGPA